MISNMTQAECEALITLMLVAKYQDNSISIAESDKLNEIALTLPWKSGTALSIFISQRIAQVRKALADPDSRKELLGSQIEAFASSDHRETALDAIRWVLRADGLAESENDLLEELGRLTKDVHARES